MPNPSHIFFDAGLETKLHQRKESGILRSLSLSNHLIDFCSNDYLGLSTDSDFERHSAVALATGATGSRLISGNSQLAEETETLIADYHGWDAALIYNSGYMANVGLFSCLADRGDSFIADENIHASIIDGMRLSHTQRYKFKHNDLNDLEHKLTASSGKKIVIVESIYSMDGDEAPLQEISALCNKHNALLIVDEAHAVGVFGKKGEGLVSFYNLQKDVYACIYTYGKACGFHGAAIAGSKILRDYLINFSRSFIYTTALPPHDYLQIQKAYAILPQANRNYLFELITYFRDKIKTHTMFFFMDSFCPIQGIVLGNNQATQNLAKHLQAEGFFVKAILSPTVKAGTERIRICLHAHNTHEQIDDLFTSINNF